MAKQINLRTFVPVTGEPFAPEGCTGPALASSSVGRTPKHGGLGFAVGRFCRTSRAVASERAQTTHFGVRKGGHGTRAQNFLASSAVAFFDLKLAFRAALPFQNGFFGRRFFIEGLFCHLLFRLERARKTKLTALNVQLFFNIKTELDVL